MTVAFHGIRLVLLDIEGTICPISFVKEVLFPYALQALPDVLKRKWHDADFQQYRDQFPPAAQSSPAALEAHVKELTEKDMKVACLKNLQGYLWQTGYEDGSYTTELFPDVLARLKHWRQTDIELAIFSSGSVFAQKLLFRHVKNVNDNSNNDNGNNNKNSESSAMTVDQTGLIRDWFDTVNAGSKLQPSSYKKIAEALGRRTNELLFLSDNVGEIAAALEADMPAVLVERPGNAALSEQVVKTFCVVSSLDQISVNAAAAVAEGINGLAQGASCVSGGPV